ncbi:anti-sigma factor [Cesiribacter andamanensis]|uniref:Uncharacterized protein n=1 Tax=Cesiribacter andamanensis AMV16 TaxID=1279009 RepID=M7N776_9BACT|nr:hypothetical protein [Cesiribacter andamanensis]EMR03096.1 hypothetical protein ADICEAN_01755 [Cesiribacter andamanensis AMV16]
MSTASSFIWDEESRDLLLFDYLEGNLPEEKAAMLEQALAADPALQAALSSWQASVVAEPYYPTGQLEAALLKIPQASPGLSYSGLAWSVVLLLLLSLMPAAHYPLQLPPAHAEQQAQDLAKDSLHQPPQKLQEAAPPLSDAASPIEQAAASSIGSRQPLQAASPLLQSPVVPLAEQLPVLDKQAPAEVQVQRVLPPLYPLPAKAQPRQIAPKQISRQQARQIRHMKEKALRQKQANEFMKGNRPYVVPLDTKNF